MIAEEQEDAEGADDPTHHLRNPVEGNVLPGHALGDRQAEGDRGIDVAAGHGSIQIR